ncbi:unnamed protein product [Penicillium pancosmium]
MQEEARNTETHHRLRDNGNLRTKAITFVSAGELQRSEFENLEQDGDMQDGVEKENENEKAAEAEGEGEPQTECTIEIEQKNEEVPVKEGDEPLFVLDSVGETVPDTGLSDPAPLADPDISDDSSEDEVVFTGRNNKPIVIETDERDLRILQNLQGPAPQSVPVLQTEELTLRTQESHPTPAPAQSRRKPPKRERFKWSPDNDDILADYIANMDQDSESESESEAEEERSWVQAGPEGGMGAQANNDEIGVESSIDVLSKMHIDTKPDNLTINIASDVELDTPNTSDLEELDSDDDDLDADILEQLALEYAQTHKKKGKSSKFGFPSASAFADAIDADPYYGFDIMDFDRPSLSKSGKGKKQPPDFDLMLSDSELEMHMQDVWQTDRKKKAAKKKEREELRSQGVLGKDPEDADLRQRYSKGMNMEELMTEIRAFLMSSKTTLSLPPMTKNRRKTIHELANVVNLKSQSKGNGLTRFPILIKTSRTPGYTRKTISKVDSLLSGRKLNRRLFASWGADGHGKQTKTKPRGGGGVTSGVTYMDGDVVGGSAPEIGAGNRGRAMLEKMGWSSGTALGASNNKGILQPVTHVVKNSRTGLG